MCPGKLIKPCIVFDIRYINPGNAIIPTQSTVSRIVGFISPVVYVLFLRLVVSIKLFDSISFILASRGQPCLLLPVSLLPYNINK